LISNAVEDSKVLTDNLIEKSAFRLAMVGIVPSLKRVDIALDIIDKLHKIDERYELLIKSKLPTDFKWMHQRKNEISW
jgi:hypothetical protein